MTIKKTEKLTALIMKKLESKESANEIITITRPALENLIHYTLIKEK